MGHVINKKSKTELVDYSNITEIIPARYIDGNLLICWNGKSIAILEGGLKDLNTLNKYKGLMDLNADYLVIAGSWQVMGDFQNYMKGRENIIFDSSNSHRLPYPKVEDTLESIYFVPVHGPYIRPINN